MKRVQLLGGETTRHLLEVAHSFVRVGILIAALTTPVGAQASNSDILIVGRTLDFVGSLKHGDTYVGIVFDPNIALSSQRAAGLNKLMTNGVRTGHLFLKPVMVPIGQLNSGNVDVFVLAEGLGVAAIKVRNASRERKIPCITFDLSQVQNGNCAIGVRPLPRVEVIVNRATADASGIVFAALFRMMITEI